MLTGTLFPNLPIVLPLHQPQLPQAIKQKQDPTNERNYSGYDHRDLRGRRELAVLDAVNVCDGGKHASDGVETPWTNVTKSATLYAACCLKQ